jgi:sulfate adenylyltransferase subunit 1
VEFDEERFTSIRDEYLEFAEKLNKDIDIKLIPLSALDGDNVVSLSEKTPWYKGDSLLTLLEDVDFVQEQDSSNFRFPVQYVNRPNLDFRGFAGTIASGLVKVGDKVKALPSGKISTIDRIVTFDGDLPEASFGQAITLTLKDEIDISRGDTIVAADDDVPLSNNLLADIVWMAEAPLEVGRQYDIKVAGKKTVGSVQSIRHQVDINNLETFTIEALPLNGIGLCEVVLNEAIAVDAYQNSIDTGGFIIIDRLTNVTVGAGMVREALIDQTVLPTGDFSAFEIEFNALVRKHFPHWNANDISKLLG